MKKILNIFIILLLVFIYTYWNMYFQKDFEKINIFDENYLEKIKIVDLSEKSSLYSMNNNYLYQLYAFLNFKNNFIKSVDIWRFEFLNREDTKQFAVDYLEKYKEKDLFFLKTIWLFVLLNKDIYDTNLKDDYAKIINNSLKVEDNNEASNIKEYRIRYKSYFDYFCNWEQYKIDSKYWDFYTLYSFYFINNKIDNNKNNLGYCLLLHSNYNSKIVGAYNLITKKLIEIWDKEKEDNFIKLIKEDIYNKKEDKATIDRYSEVIKYNEYIEKTRKYITIKNELEK